MKVDICTLFPDFFQGPLQSSIMGRASTQQWVQYRLHQIRDFTHDRHRTVDDRPFGGGPGMVLKPEPVFECLEALAPEPGTPIILTSPRAPLFTQQVAIELSGYSRLIFVCGHYEGVDERIRDQLCSHVYSIGSYVLTGGELATTVMLDAIIRLIPGVVGKMDSVEQDSFMDGLLDCPHYTRPAEFRGESVPEVLLSGNHARIEAWRHQQKLLQTRRWRPDLWEDYPLSAQERARLQTALEEEM